MREKAAESSHQGVYARLRGLSDGLAEGPRWTPGLDDLARLRALTRKGEAVIHSDLRGSSMGAALPDGARIRIRSGAENSWHQGDVIAFLAGSRLMAHRIVYEGRRGAARHFVITQGDGNWLCDPPASRSTVVGRVEAFSTDTDWRPIAGPRIAFPRRLVGRASLALMRMALELSPTFTIRAARLMSWARMGPRLVLSKLRRSLPGHVRH
jgi:hypothetical protein